MWSVVAIDLGLKVENDIVGLHHGRHHPLQERAAGLKIRVIGTGKIKQLVTVKNQQFIYARHPNADEVRPEFTGRDFEPGSNYYYTRVVQTDGQVAWSSPIWAE